jgi:LEA14-like dessication related protein
MIRFLSSFLFLIFLLSSCQYQDVKYLGVSSIGNVQKEKKSLTVDVDFKLANPNTFSVKLLPSTVDVLLNDKKIGTVHLDKKIKLLKKSEDVYTAKLNVELADNINLLGIAANALFSKTTIRFKGKVKAGASLFSKKFDLDETRELDLNQLKNLVEKFK